MIPSAVDLLFELLAIPGKSGEERAIAQCIVGKLRAAGLPDDAIQFDNAPRQSPLGGQVGNLIVKLPGVRRAPRRLLMAHMDTVPLCVGARPIRQGDYVRSADPRTALGGDDRAGAAVVLHTALSLLDEPRPHPPLTLLWTVQEEVGLVGARLVSAAKLGRPRMGFNWDGGAPDIVTIGATGAFHLVIRVHGLASHAGAHPEDGVSAVAIAARAIAELVDNGWHGLVIKGKNAGSSNVGVIQGGAATNVVTDEVVLQAEVRSHDPAFRQKIVGEFRKAFTRAAQHIRSAAGVRGKVDFDVIPKYESFRLSEDAPAVQAACGAIRAAGGAPVTKISNGGLDANWLTAHGCPTVTLGCGQADIHTTAESLHLGFFERACRIAGLLATGE